MIKIERKVWGAPVNSRGDSVIEFTPGISREADDYGMPLNGDLPERHAALFAFTRPSGRMTMVIAQGDYTRFEGMGRRYNMRGVAELAAEDASSLNRPLAVLLDHIDVIHDYDSENRQVDAVVATTTPSAVRPSGATMSLINAIALAILDDCKVYIRLPQADALFGDKIRQASRLGPLLEALDTMPQSVRPRLGLAFGVEDGYRTYSRFIADARVVAHFGDIATPQGAIIIDWSGDTPTLPAAVLKQRDAFARLTRRERPQQRSQYSIHTADVYNNATDAPTPTGQPTTSNEQQPMGSNRWATWWHALTQAGPLPAILALVCLLGGALLGSRLATVNTATSPAPRHEAVITGDTLARSQTLVQLRHYSFTDSLGNTTAISDTLTGDIAFDHPMTHIAQWNLEALWRTNNVHIAMKMRLRNDSIYTDTLMSQAINRERLLALNRAYYASLGDDALSAEFAGGCSLALSNGGTITITPDNSLLEQAVKLGDGTMVQIKSLTVAGKTFEIDNDAFQTLNGGVKRGLNMPVYYLWAVSQLEQCRLKADINKLFAY